jgi:L-threonylcarbamoyladenylate synthase
MAAIAVAFPQVYTLLPSEVEALVSTGDRAPQPSGVASTVIRWTGNDWEVLRQGAVWVQ